jgi:hypothetical protein
VQSSKHSCTEEAVILSLSCAWQFEL